MSLSMMPRGRVDIGWTDLALGALSCMVPGSDRRKRRRIEARVGASDTLVCLSVRSGLDLFLATMKFPAGSEILVSAVTIRDMVRIIEAHGLVAVPVDLDMQALEIDLDSLDRARTARTRAVLVAHLFGSTMPLQGVAEFARRHDLLLLEDCAQSFTGSLERGHDGVDVTLYSFGPIKTATALGAAVLRFREPGLRDRMAAALDRQPRQGRGEFLKRVGRFAVVRGLLDPVPFGLFYRACRARGLGHDDVVSQSIRGFGDDAFFRKIRRRPSYPLLALLEHRLRRFRGRAIARRTEAGVRASTWLRGVERPGVTAAAHSYWTYPIAVPDPEALCEHLWRNGFDATRGRWSLYTVPPPDAERRPAGEAERIMRRVVYLPVVHPRMTGPRLRTLADVVLEPYSGNASGSTTSTTTTSTTAIGSPTRR